MSLPGRRYHLTTFGCQMNEHDSERMRGVLEANGWSPAADPEEADLLLFNTCSVRESAESRLLGRLGDARRLKNERPDRLIAIAGCFAQSRREDIFRDLPFLDIAIGPGDIGELAALAEAAAAQSTPVSSFSIESVPIGGLPARRIDPYRAWVQVMTGCTNFCSYCVVPSVRGPERSRPAPEIIGEVERLVDEGVVEITLLGQNVNSYGLDRNTSDNGGAGRDSQPGGHSFASLLGRLDDVKGLRRIRFITSHPKDLGDDLVEAMRDLPSVCEHLHLPVQSGSNRILGRMNRGYTREHYLELVAGLYRQIPGLALTTDIIIGFPGEKEEDFYRTMTLAAECRYDGAFTFLYSPRPGTEAADFPGRIPDTTKKRRMNELVGLTQSMALAKNEALLGSVEEVLIEGPSRHGEGLWRGRTRRNKIVNFKPLSVGLGAGDFTDVKIDSATSTTLKGVQTPPSAAGD
ncbi:MAG: tRNA (N6-isopentenyl adenosine(37)-C2)-methylthiotransferase MiaB [Thermoleophilia bacterium]